MNIEQLLDELFEKYKSETGASVFATNMFKDWLKTNLPKELSLFIARGYSITENK